MRVVSEYRYRCALTGYCCMTSEGASIVDAAHIEPWAETQNYDLTTALYAADSVSLICATQ